MSATSLQKERITESIKNNYQSLENRKQILGDRNVVERNILLLGRSKSGKTTLKQMIKDPTLVSHESNLLSDSDTIEIETMELEKSNLSLTIVDANGLCGRPEDYEKLSMIRQVTAKRGIDNFHCICYCLSLEAGIRQQDIAAVKNIINCYGEHIKSILCMVITRCEGKVEEQRTRIKAEIEQDYLFKDVIKLFDQGVHFSGCLKYDDWYQGNEALYNQFSTIYGYREKLLHLFRKNIERVCIEIPSKPTVSNSTSIVTIDERSTNGSYQHTNVAQNRYIHGISILYYELTEHCFELASNRLLCKPPLDLFSLGFLKEM
ncbi:unnamed protein product [Adineta ricciae]|uniref:AIG1-type G domain-containing protein n=1 Tax=Adineta ricciae TaxID=249248 RepID=A0A815WEK6_ADIRI|nr:unnamed protein product [Adineta ricciae]